MDEPSVAEKDSLDSHMGGLLHQLLLVTSINLMFIITLSDFNQRVSTYNPHISEGQSKAIHCDFGGLDGLLLPLSSEERWMQTVRSLEHIKQSKTIIQFTVIVSDN